MDANAAWWAAAASKPRKHRHKQRHAVYRDTPPLGIHDNAATGTSKSVSQSHSHGSFPRPVTCPRTTPCILPHADTDQLTIILASTHYHCRHVLIGHMVRGRYPATLTMPPAICASPEPVEEGQCQTPHPCQWLILQRCCNLVCYTLRFWAVVNLPVGAAHHSISGFK
ncbi:hypothetical protein E2P81_ATG07914 [Venturia nashicola]|uniref:Uncharacterized protein n=1 Tax=Venturia nashicola TaxID=86259 RepID=A0A4Z1P5V3_9PEZI|nr:hypothetical protein E6O75_ATG08085 [Venturia nashicola]TLD26102.1 hypothetical protein E2P81_ATG07914 [Venturia nashicola]